jgi:predicted RecB family nuclease
MARYIEATETRDKSLRETMLSDVAEYNREDLAATWAVLSWLKEIRAALSRETVLSTDTGGD